MLLLQEKVIILFKIISSLSRNGSIFFNCGEWNHSMELYGIPWRSSVIAVEHS